MTRVNGIKNFEKEGTLGQAYNLRVEQASVKPVAKVGGVTPQLKQWKFHLNQAISAQNQILNLVVKMLNKYKTSCHSKPWTEFEGKKT